MTLQRIKIVANLFALVLDRKALHAYCHTAIAIRDSYLSRSRGDTIG